MDVFSLFLVILVVFFTKTSSLPLAADKPIKHPLILISFDGLGWKALDSSVTHTPNFDFIAKTGVKARNLYGVHPVKTFPTHTTFLTGLYPESHGIIDDKFWDPQYLDKFIMEHDCSNFNPKFYNESEPLWMTMEKRGRKTGMYFWPGSTSYELKPSFYVNESCNVNCESLRDPMDLIYLRLLLKVHCFFNFGMTYKQRIDTIVDEWLMSNDPPEFVSLFIEEPDLKGHQKGPNDKGYLKKVEELDKNVLGYLLKRLKDRRLIHTTNLLIVSDYGLVETTNTRQIRLNDYISPDSYFSNIANIQHIWPKPGMSQEVYENLKSANNPHLLVYKKDDIPDALHYKNHRRIPPIYLIVEEGWLMRKDWNAIAEDEWTEGAHESPPSDNSAGIFYARGPAFKRGYSSPRSAFAIDLYSLLCHLVDEKPLANNGSLDNMIQFLRRNFTYNNTKVWPYEVSRIQNNKQYIKTTNRPVSTTNRPFRTTNRPKSTTNRHVSTTNRPVALIKTEIATTTAIMHESPAMITISKTQTTTVKSRPRKKETTSTITETSTTEASTTTDETISAERDNQAVLKTTTIEGEKLIAKSQIFSTVIEFNTSSRKVETKARLTTIETNLPTKVLTKPQRRNSVTREQTFMKPTVIPTVSTLINHPTISTRNKKPTTNNARNTIYLASTSDDRATKGKLNSATDRQNEYSSQTVVRSFVTTKPRGDRLPELEIKATPAWKTTTTTDNTRAGQIDRQKSRLQVLSSSDFEMSTERKNKFTAKQNPTLTETYNEDRFNSTSTLTNIPIIFQTQTFQPHTTRIRTKVYSHKNIDKSVLKPTETNQPSTRLDTSKTTQSISFQTNVIDSSGLTFVTITPSSPFDTGYPLLSTLSISTRHAITKARFTNESSHNISIDPTVRPAAINRSTTENSNTDSSSTSIDGPNILALLGNRSKNTDEERDWFEDCRPYVPEYKDKDDEDADPKPKNITGQQIHNKASFIIIAVLFGLLMTDIILPSH